MAKVLYNDYAMITGSVNGKTYSHNRYGNYIRNRANPTNPQTDLQGIVRAQCATLNNQWSLRTSDQKKLWEQSASSYLLPNGVGGYYVPTGAQLFRMVNQNRLINSESIVNVPFPKGGYGSLLQISSIINVPAGTFKVLFSCDSLTTLPVKLYFTPATMNGRSLGSCKNQLRMLRDVSLFTPILTNCGPIEFDITTFYDQQFGTNISGNVLPTAPIFTKFVVIQSDYTQSAPIYLNSIIIP